MRRPQRPETHRPRVELRSTDSPTWQALRASMIERAARDEDLRKSSDRESNILIAVLAVGSVVVAVVLWLVVRGVG